MGFKERLREEIEFKGLLIKEVSAALGISNSTFLSYIDARGVLPNVETAVKIANYLGVTVEYLVNGEAVKDSEKIKSSATSEKERLSKAYDKLSTHNKTVLVKIAEMLNE